MTIPTVQEAHTLLEEAGRLNPGPWLRHSWYVGDAAARLAAHLPGLCPDTARSLGLLHDIGRRAGVTGMRHIIDGYSFLMGRGFDQAARICLTHSFPVKDLYFSVGLWDCTTEESAFIAEYLERTAYDDYDRLFQLCDALALPEGFCLLEKRFVDVALRHGFSEGTISRWRATMELRSYFERTLGGSVYRYLPGVVETTFDFGSQE
ncbi:MAG: HD domain-containing protein [Chloroflexales bacterium]|nr:HD domain-containing protein [Chloroflexales bacterium]